MTPNKKQRLKVEYVPIRSIKPAKTNTRIHPPEQIQEIANSITTNGWTKPIIVDEKREILAGHGAYSAALQLGMTEIPIIARQGLSQAQKRAYRVFDNKAAEGSNWDEKLLAVEFTALQEMGFDLTLTGFKAGEIEDLLRPPASQDAEPPIVDTAGHAVSKAGDLWLMGDHRLICADSTKPATYETLMDGRQASMVFTDPPYGVSYQASSGKFEEMTGDKLRQGQLRKMLSEAFANAVAHTTDSAAWYVWHADKTAQDFRAALNDHGIVESCCIIWVKLNGVMDWWDYHQTHEPCFYAHKQGCKPAFYGDRSHTTVWRMSARTAVGQPAAIVGQGLILATERGDEIYISTAPPKGKKVRHQQTNAGESVFLALSDGNGTVWEVGRDRGHGKENSIHPTQKPVELARRAIRNSSREGEIVLDFFNGSGSTIIGAEQLKRKCYAIDLEPKYIDAAVRRWQTLTGKAATHAKDGKTFEAIAKARAGGKAKAR